MNIRHAMFGELGKAELATIGGGPAKGGCTVKAILDGLGVSVELELTKDEAKRLHTGLERYAKSEIVDLKEVK